MAHDRLAAARSAASWNGGHVVHAHHTAADDGGRRGYRLAIHVSDIGGEVVPHAGAVEDFAKPGQRHVKARRADGATRVLHRPVADSPHLDRRQLAHWRRHVFGEHAGQFHGLVEIAFAEDRLEPPPGAAVQPAVADPIGPALAAGRKVYGCPRYARIHLYF